MKNLKIFSVILSLCFCISTFANDSIRYANVCEYVKNYYKDATIWISPCLDEYWLDPLWDDWISDDPAAEVFCIWSYENRDTMLKYENLPYIHSPYDYQDGILVLSVIKENSMIAWLYTNVQRPSEASRFVESGVATWYFEFDGDDNVAFAKNSVMHYFLPLHYVPECEESKKYFIEKSWNFKPEESDDLQN